MKLISKCCGSEVRRNKENIQELGFYCLNCRKSCDTIEQDEEKVKDKSFNSDYCKGYIQGQMDAFNGKIQNLKELNITEKVNVIPELQEYFRKQGKEEADKEWREKLDIDKGDKKD